MTGKTGDELGVELGRLWYAGKHDLPEVAGDYEDAGKNIPSSVSEPCNRGGGLGSSPGSSLDSFTELVRKMLNDTGSSVTHAGAALVWIADNYAATDQTCKSSFDSTKSELQQAGGGS